ncbi:MAG: response regulator transcription factor [Candidatus Eremiobacteraeota bacterium]|nr:response regulator transcription factor [Candidatus Eremiobacteraeota bacterium]
MRALIIEPQRLFTPFLAGVLEERGVAVLATTLALDRDQLALARPEIVLIDADHLPSPLMALADLRSALPSARIAVVYAWAEAAWLVLARAFGADVLIGPGADEERLVLELGLRRRT